MTKGERRFLVFSIVLSLLIWGWLVSPSFGLIIVPSVLIHEYGHYFWMGREGIRKRSMTMLPPFGAVAMAGDPWPSRGAEARIAIAGPAAGLLPTVFFFACWLASGNEYWKASTFLAAYINLFNLLAPVAILDGGRIIKSVLFSISGLLGYLFYALSFAVVLAAPAIFPGSLLIAMLIGYMLWRDFSSMRLGWLANLLPMSSREIAVSLTLYAAVLGAHALLLLNTKVALADMMSYFR